MKQRLVGIAVICLLFAGIQPVGAASDSFDDGVNDALWETIDGGEPSILCGATSGTRALYFNGAVERQAVTIPLDVRDGGQIEFTLRYGATNDPDGCDRGEDNEAVSLEYSVDGATWTPVGLYYPGNLSTFRPFAVSIPPAARTQNTRFRWRQTDWASRGEDPAGTRWDHWALDDVVIPTATLNSLPTSADLRLAVIRGTSLTFQASDFLRAYDDPDGNPLAFIQVETLPESGVLRLGTDPVSEGTQVSANRLPELVFEPEPGFTGATTFTFRVGDGSDTSQAPASAVISVGASAADLVPSAPQTVVASTETTFATVQNRSVQLSLPDDVIPASVRVTSQPANGELIVTSNQVTFEPERNFAGAESFSLRGQTSDGSSITIVVSGSVIGLDTQRATDLRPCVEYTEPGSRVLVEGMLPLDVICRVLPATQNHQIVEITANTPRPLDATVCLRGMGDLFQLIEDVLLPLNAVPGPAGYACARDLEPGLVLLSSTDTSLTLEEQRIQETPLEACTITTQFAIPMRQGPNEQSTELATLSAEAELTALAITRNGWFSVAVEDQQGYVFSEFVDQGEGCAP